MSESADGRGTPPGSEGAGSRTQQIPLPLGALSMGEAGTSRRREGLDSEPARITRPGEDDSGEKLRSPEAGRGGSPGK